MHSNLLDSLMKGPILFLAVLWVIFIPSFAEAEGFNLDIPLSHTKESISYVYDAPLDDLQSTPLLTNSLGQIPGLCVYSSGVTGQLATISFRGMGPSHTLVMLDDMPFNTGGSGIVDFSHFLSGSFDKVIAIPDASPVLYGPGSGGGVVSLTTGQGGAQIKVEGGSFNDIYAYGRQTIGSKKQSFTGHVEGMYTRGLPQYGKPRMFGEKSAYNNQTVTGRYDYKGEKFSVKATVRAMQDNGHYDNSINLGPKPQGRQSTQNQVGTLSVDYEGLLHHSMGAFFNAQDNQTGNDNFNDTLTLGAVYKGGYEWNSAQKTLIVGSVNRTRLKKELGFSSSKFQIGAGAQHTVFLTPKFFVLGGVRSDYYASLKNLITCESAIGYKDHLTSVKLGIRRGIRLPTLYDLYVEDVYTQANPNLKAERSRTVDMTLDHQLVDKLRVQISPYITQAHQFISNTFTSAGKWTMVNVSGKTIIKGIDGNMDWAITDQWKIKPSYSLTQVDYHNVSFLSPYPKQQGSVEAIYKPSETWQLFSSVVGIGARKGKIGNQLYSLKPVQLFNLGTDFFVTSQHKLYIKINNVFDCRYEQIYNYRSPGRAFYIGFHGYF